MQIKDVVILRELDRQRLGISKTEQAMCSNNNYAALFNKPTEVI
jgi:hypothetical protein